MVRVGGVVSQARTFWHISRACMKGKNMRPENEIRVYSLITGNHDNFYFYELTRFLTPKERSLRYTASRDKRG